MTFSPVRLSASKSGLHSDNNNDSNMCYILSPFKHTYSNHGHCIKYRIYKNKKIESIKVYLT